ncbi:MAG: hypothetical protein M1358_07335 [Chloroflexi bacterium]|nr:hypothetical protein [Chloroflexota bacterium]
MRRLIVDTTGLQRVTHIVEEHVWSDRDQGDQPVAPTTLLWTQGCLEAESRVTLITSRIHLVIS